LNRTKLLFLCAFAITTIGIRANSAAWAWGNQGHEIVAIIAADNLSPAAGGQVARILGTASDTGSLEKAMAAASVRPDTEFREEDRATAPWHFIDICLQDQRSEEPARCPARDCVTAKIDEYIDRLKAGNYDQWGADGDLTFLIHLVGDIHQPLHAATDADRGGNCITAAWDTAVVYRLEDSVDSGNPDATAHKLEQLYASQKDADSWKPGGTSDIAWESNQVARAQVYQALRIPVEPCEPEANSCVHAPGAPVALDDAYMNKAATIAGGQLAKAGFRLASL
jgi:S1/P1 Nuclease